MLRSAPMVTVLCLLFSACPLLCQGPEVKLGFGLTQGGAVEDSWSQTEYYYTFQVLSGQKANVDLEASVEIIYMFHKNFGLSFGLGYLSKRIESGKIRFIPSPESEYLAGFSYSPELEADVTPFTLSGLFKFILFPHIKLIVRGGLGYYIGTLRCQSAGWDIEEREDWDEWNHLTFQMQSDISSFGIHLGTGLEIELPWKFVLSLETLYRSVRFRHFDTSYYGHSTDTARINYYADWEKGQAIIRAQDTTWDSWFLYAQRLLGSEEQGDFGYSLSEFNLDGLSFRVGVKLRF